VLSSGPFVENERSTAVDRLTVMRTLVATAHGKSFNGAVRPLEISDQAIAIGFGS